MHVLYVRFITVCSFIRIFVYLYRSAVHQSRRMRAHRLIIVACAPLFKPLVYATL